MRGGRGALTRSGLDDGYYWDAERCQFTVEPLLPLAPRRTLRQNAMVVRQHQERFVEDAP
jgi:hypothetical protein